MSTHTYLCLGNLPLNYSFSLQGRGFSFSFSFPCKVFCCLSSTKAPLIIHRESIQPEVTVQGTWVRTPHLRVWPPWSLPRVAKTSTILYSQSVTPSPPFPLLGFTKPRHSKTTCFGFPIAARISVEVSAFILWLPSFLASLSPIFTREQRRDEVAQTQGA